MRFDEDLRAFPLGQGRIPCDEGREMAAVSCVGWRPRLGRWRRMQRTFDEDALRSPGSGTEI